jgi:PIN domain nuclease of toxin-antitoxin system
LRVLLDSHVLLWARYETHRLSDPAKTVLATADLVVSVITPWELAGKIARGQLGLPESVDEAIDALGCQRLPVTHAHVRQLVELPPIHWDPFDRMLAAQALTEELRLMTADRRLLRYPIRLIPA